MLVCGGGAGGRVRRVPSAHEEEADRADKAGAHLDARPARVSAQRLQPGWRLLRGLPFSGTGASVKEGWPGCAPWGGGH